MKNSEILELSSKDLVDRIKQEKFNLQKLKFAHAVSAIENPMRIKAAKKLIAQLSTELTAKRTAEGKEKQGTAAEAQ